MAGAVAPADGPIVVEHAAESDVLLVVHPDRVERCDPVPAGSAGEPFDPLTPAVHYAEVPAGEVVGDEAAARRLRRAGEVLTAAMLVGVAQGALDVAASYAKERQQFGVPIGSFQAIKHILADMYVRTEHARAAAYAAAAISTTNGRAMSRRRRAPQSCSGAKPASRTGAPRCRSSAAWASRGRWSRTTT